MMNYSGYKEGIREYGIIFSWSDLFLPNKLLRKKKPRDCKYIISIILLFSSTVNINDHGTSRKSS